MNWADIVLIVTLVTGGLMGMRIGIIRASFAVIGVLAGILALAEFRDGSETWLAGYLPNGALIVVLSSATIIFATFAATWLASKITRNLVYGMFMGWMDRIGGMAAGLAVGAVLAAAMILSVTGLLNSQKSPEDEIPGKILNRTPLSAEDISGLEAKFTESSVASLLLSAADMIPDKARDLAPVGWRDALENLEDRLEVVETARR